MSIFKKGFTCNKHCVWPDAPQIINDFACEMITTAEKAGVDVFVGHGNSLVMFKDVLGVKHRALGYFSDDQNNYRPELAFSLGYSWERGFRTLIHEYSHFLQWQEQSSIWTNGVIQGQRMGYWIQNWIMGANYEPDFIHQVFTKIRAIEMDCEKRAMALAIEKKLPVPFEKYAQLSNVNVMHYHYVETHRKYIAQKYNLSTFTPILSKAPITLGDPEILPIALGEAFDKYFGIKHPFWEILKNKFNNILNFNEFIELEVSNFLKTLD